MPRRGALTATVALAMVLAPTGCGEEGAPVGAPVPPGPGVATDCAEIGAGARQRPISPAGRPPYGFNDSAALNGAMAIPRVAGLQASIGASLWRVALDWRFAEPEPGENVLRTHDAIYCSALARGIRPIFHITGAPEWAADDTGDCPVPSCIDPPSGESLGELREFAELVGRRYPELAAIEAWNEPNLATFWTEPDPDRYVDVLAAIAAGAEDAGTGIPVLGGSLSNTGRTDPEVGHYDFADFLSAMYAAGAAEQMDALAFHPYPLEPLGSKRERFSASMAELRETMRRYGDAGRPIWVTEVGLPVGGAIGERDQAETMRGIYDRLAADRDVDAVVFHTLLEGHDAVGSGSGFGWLVPGEDGEPVPPPVYREFARRP